MANRVIEENGNYFTINPASKNVRELTKDETIEYLLSKERLSENDLKWKGKNSPIVSGYDKNLKNIVTPVSELDDSTIAAHARMEDYRAMNPRNLPYNIENRPPYLLLDRKAIEQEAYDRGAVSTTAEDGWYKGKTVIEIPPKAPMTDDQFFQTSSDPAPVDYPVTPASYDDLFPVSDEIENRATPIIGQGAQALGEINQILSERNASNAGRNAGLMNSTLEGFMNQLGHLQKNLFDNLANFAMSDKNPLRGFGEKIASHMAVQDPNTNEIPGGIVGSEAYNAEQLLKIMQPGNKVPK